MVLFELCRKGVTHSVETTENNQKSVFPFEKQTEQNMFFEGIMKAFDYCIITSNDFTVPAGIYQVGNT